MIEECIITTKIKTQIAIDSTSTPIIRNCQTQLIGEELQLEKKKIREAKLWLQRGFTRGKSGNYQEAIEAFDEAIALEPNNAEAFYNRGLARVGLNQYQWAIEDYNQTLRLDPKHYQAYNHRGLAYQKLKKYEKAIADYDEAIRLNFNYSEVYNDRGFAYRQLEEYEKAIADYDRAIPFDSESKLNKEENQPSKLDFSLLQNLLEQKKWQEANEETRKLLLKSVNRENQKWLRLKDIENISGNNLQTIDRLWLYYSNNRFGFSVQKRILEKIDNLENEQAREKSGEILGWLQNNRWLNISDLNYSIDANEGHLPFFDWSMPVSYIVWSFLIGICFGIWKFVDLWGWIFGFIAGSILGCILGFIISIFATLIFEFKNAPGSRFFALLSQMDSTEHFEFNQFKKNYNNN